MTSLPSITVVTPSYNQADFLEQTLTSVLGQDYPKLEYIVMDGGSSDRSPEIIEKYGARLAYWVSEKDKGQADAIQRGLARGTGELMCWINSDDVMLPGTLHHFAEVYRENPNAGFLAGGAVLIDPNGHIIRTRYGVPDLAWTRGIITFESLLARWADFLQPGTIWRRDLFDRIGGLDTSMRFCFDRDLFLRLARETSAFGTNRLVAGYRMHPASKTSTLQDVRKEEGCMLQERYGFADRPLLSRCARRSIAMVRNRWRKLSHTLAFYRNAYDIPEHIGTISTSD